MPHLSGRKLVSTVGSFPNFPNFFDSLPSADNIGDTQTVYMGEERISTTISDHTIQLHHF